MKYSTSSLIAVSLFAVALSAHAVNEKKLDASLQQLSTQCQTDLSMDQGRLIQEVLTDLPKAILSLELPRTKMQTICSQLAAYRATWSLADTEENRWRLVSSVMSLQYESAQILNNELVRDSENVKKVSFALGMRPKDVLEYSMVLTNVRGVVQEAVNQVSAANNIPSIDLSTTP